MSKISALIIEDEIENIELVKLYLSKYFKEIELIYSTTNLKEGIELYLEHRQQILFLDIDLGKGTTIFEFLDHYLISSSEIIFITSFEQFAIKAINIGYVSAYITKPLKIDEFVNAVSKTIDKINKQKGNLNIENNRNNHSIAVASTNKVDLIPIEELICCTAKGKYTVFETSNKEVFISLGGQLSKVYRTEVSVEEYLAYTTEEPEKVKVQVYAKKYGSMQKGIMVLAQELKNKNGG